MFSIAAAPVTFVFTSDVHFGINRGNFRGAANVESRLVNAALVQKINGLPGATLPPDDGLRAGEPVGPVDFVVITGDLANRQELYPLPIQSATVSWGQFEACYIDGLKLRNPAGQPTPLLLVPGNHDVSNAIGYPAKLVPATDATSIAQIYNRMMQPATPRTKDSYRYATDKIYYSRDFGGVHALFLTIWPDTTARAWIDRLHQLGDTYVSLTRAEGWGMGAFDAAALGRPVLMTGWSGHLDFLGRDHPGLIGGALAPIDWPGTSYGPDHRWAVADVADARSKMRYRFVHRGQPDPHARLLGERIANLYAEGPVMRRFRHAIGA